MIKDYTSSFGGIRVNPNAKEFPVWLTCYDNNGVRVVQFKNSLHIVELSEEDGCTEDYMHSLNAMISELQDYADYLQTKTGELKCK